VDKKTNSGEQKVDSFCAQKLSKSFAATTVVDSISLEVWRGEVVGLLGPNGAGKTTLFYLLVGLLAPQQGKVFLEGQEITHLPMHKRARLGLGYLPQNSSIFTSLSVRDNLLGVMEVLGFSRAQKRETLDNLVSEYSLANIIHSPGSALSGGERRRVEVVRALLLQPKFLFLDEPFAGVDPVVVAQLQKMLQTLRAQNIGVIISDHNVRETLSCCQRSYVLSQGRVIAQGRAEVILQNPVVQQHYLGKEFRI
jgi:lipopolysaccharide export system ATP-binding protein